MRYRLGTPKKAIVGVSTIALRVMWEEEGSPSAAEGGGFRKKQDSWSLRLC